MFSDFVPRPPSRRTLAFGPRAYVRPPLTDCTPGRDAAALLFGSSQSRAVIASTSTLPAACGAPGALPCPAPTYAGSFPPAQAAATASGLAGIWDYNILCSKFADAMNRLQLLITEADRVGVKSLTLDQAKSRLDAETSLLPWRRSDPNLPSTCDRVTNEVNGLVLALNAEVKAAGGTQALIDSTLPVAPTPASDPWGTVKWVAIAGVAIAGAVILVPIIGEAVGWSKLVRAGKGRR